MGKHRTGAARWQTFFWTGSTTVAQYNPADMVNKIQVYDEESEQSQLTGFDDGNTTKTMNVVTKADRRNGQFGRAYAGYDTDELYQAGATINSFNQDSRTTVLGMTNNINQQNFGNEDLAEVSGGRGRPRRGGGTITSSLANRMASPEPMH